MSPSIRERIDAAKQKDFVSVEELSLLSGISERTIWRRLKAGVFPHVLVSGRVTRVHRYSAIRALHDQIARIT